MKFFKSLKYLPATFRTSLRYSAGRLYPFADESDDFLDFALQEARDDKHHDNFSRGYAKAAEYEKESRDFRKMRAGTVGLR